jgi:16S rRNA (adenine1518-N6/adenine1519-N6)-dimethyltransferase
LGQNFLVDRNILDIIIEAADPSPPDVILEIGPGLGVVTEELLRRGARVVAVEKDARLHGFLRERLGGDGNLDLIHADALNLDLSALIQGGAFGVGRDTPGGRTGCALASPGERGTRIGKVVSNLPFRVGGRILGALVAAEAPAGRMVLTVQQEVGRRLAAAAGTSDYGMLSVWAQLSYHVEPVRNVKPNCFWPKPAVTSAIVNMKRRGAVPVSGAARDLFHRLTKRAFTFRRKQMATVLRRVLPTLGCGHAQPVDLLAAVGSDTKARPEDLTVDQWSALARLLRAEARQMR